ncbi:MAG: helix-turn-helix transcriptional regulator [Clostridia bacterium]|nr:helix-turn-helix transcriptional regulator [Clostridia bacterium]MBR2883560.1 helix-turn-helix transcriptional regulator [Clostridia bacterium]MBR3996507.1 helix-turn-helix transcriptional regulator [Clostridia bacterium]
MAVSYNKLWKLLIDKKMMKKELAEQAGISPFTLTKMTNDDSVTTDTLSKICIALGCNIEDIVEVIPDEQK